VTEYKIAFTEKPVRDAFNKGLRRLKESDQYMDIIKKYIHVN